MTQTARRGALLIPLLFLLLVAGAPLALAASWVDQDEWTVTVVTPVETDLTVTPGASGAWVEGGYDFNATGYATSAGFRPFHDQAEITLVAWVVPDTVTDWQHIFSAYEGANKEVQLVTTSGDAFRFVAANGSATVTATFGSSFAVGSLYNIVGVYNGSHAILYVNNSVVYSSTTMSGNTYANADMKIGARTGNPYWAGKIYYTACYSYALTPEEVMIIYAAGMNATYGTPLHYYMMNEGSGATFYDASANVWNHQDYWDEVSPVTNTPTYPAWNLQDNYTMYVIGYLAPVIPTDPWAGIEEAWILLIGVVCFIAGPCLPAASIRASGWSKEKLWLILMGLLIWSFGYSLLFSF